MKYVILIIDGAAGWPLPERGGKTSLELAVTPHLDALAGAGCLGLARTVPPGMEPSSACACMSVLGYDPRVYYKGRATIEARSRGIAVGPDEAVFRCNLVTVADGNMDDYSGGHITTAEAGEIIQTLNEKLGGEDVTFYPGLSYRHILKLRGHAGALKAACTPPHDIPGKKISGYLPRGEGSKFLRDLMARSQDALRGHQINQARLARGDKPVTHIWLFWGSGRVPEMPPFSEAYGLKAALTSGVDLLKGLALMADMTVLDIPGVTDGPDSDNAAQAEGALKALEKHDLVVIHIEAPDEAAHGGDAAAKIAAIEGIDAAVVSRLRAYPGDLRLLIMPDHLTPVKLRTHTADPVPFLLCGGGISPHGAARLTEAGAAATGVIIDEGYKIMGRLLGKW